MRRAVELFVGAGGLGMGVSLAGFDSALAVERDQWACETIRQNQARGLQAMGGWPLWEGDVAEVDYQTTEGAIDLVVGGPPCQPFSMGGLHHAHLDSRDMFPEAIRAVRELAPPAFLFENVKGLARSSFADYFDFIRLSLKFPDAIGKPSEEWETHLARLRDIESWGQWSGLRYQVRHKVINAANHGVPQRRERVFIVGFRSDLGIDWEFPKETHSRQSLLWEKWRTRQYWDRHELILPKDAAQEAERRQAERLTEEAAHLLPWATVRDALSNLPDPEREPHLASDYHDHAFIKGARTYKGHTGSLWDRPAKILKAEVHGVPGGENMLRREDGTVRYFSVREAARLQTFPDDMRFHGSWSEVMRQLGNAVPTRLALVLARSIHEALDERIERRPEISGGNRREALSPAG